MAEREMAWDRGAWDRGGWRALALRHPAAKPGGSHLHGRKPNGNPLGVECAQATIRCILRVLSQAP